MNSIDSQKLYGIRGWAVLFVIFSHGSNKGLHFLELNFGGSGRYGVFLFFVLSAFLLSWQFIQAKDISTESVKKYLVRRFYRIYPLFVIAMLTYVGLYLAGIKIIKIDVEDFLKLLFLIDDRPLFWTIVVEFQFYLILPMLMSYLLMLKTKAHRLILVTLLFTVSAIKIEPKYSGVVIEFLPVFLAGVLAAIIYHGREKIKKYWLLNHIVILMSFSVFFITVPALYEIITGLDIENEFFHNQFVLYALSSALLIITVLSVDKHVIFDNKIIVFLGKISFSAYLFHLVPLYFVSHFLGDKEWAFIVYFALTVGLSYTSYKHIEMPLYAKSHKIK